MLTFMNEIVAALVGVDGSNPPRKWRSEDKNRDIEKRQFLHQQLIALLLQNFLTEFAD